MRDLVLGNGSLMVNIDRDLNIRDLYWPYAGFENHGDGNRSGMGVHADHQFSWLHDPKWKKTFDYIEDSPISSITAHNEEVGITCVINDAVHPAEDVYLKRILIRNERAVTREIKLFFYQDFSIHGIEAGDSAVFDPVCGGIYQYKKGTYILANCMAGNQRGAADFSAGVKRCNGREGTFRDAEDGHLARNTVSDGSVDSVVSTGAVVPPGGEVIVYYWLIAGHSLADVRLLDEQMYNRGPDQWLEEAVRHYRCWIKKAGPLMEGLETEEQHLCQRSLFVVRSQIDRLGAVMASPDADTFLFARDHYMYVWPRDAALIAYALDTAGYPEEARRIFVHAGTVIHPEGYFLQRYNTNGSPGCTWHPSYLHEEEILPIQLDETALIIWAFGMHCSMSEDQDLLLDLYPSLIQPALHFLCQYADPSTGLPGMSWDLWEERRGIQAFTCGAVCGALLQGIEMANALGDQETGRQCREALHVRREAMNRYLYHEGLGRFLRGMHYSPGGECLMDYTVDASLYGIWKFGTYLPDDPRVARTMQAVEENLWVQTAVGGIARYTGDYYYRVSDDLSRVPGNPWILTTLWLADWYITAGKTEADQKRARELIQWAARRTGPAGLLPEQLHPYTGEGKSVCPLTWSHATFLSTMAAYQQRFSRCIH